MSKAYLVTVKVGMPTQNHTPRPEKGKFTCFVSGQQASTEVEAAYIAEGYHKENFSNVRARNVREIDVVESTRRIS